MADGKMNFEEFEKFQEDFFDEIRKLKASKGKEYARDVEDRFANFNRIAKDLNFTNLEVAYVYAKKHLDAIVSYINTRETYSEPIRGRFLDAITYLLLMAGMAEVTEAATPKRGRPVGSKTKPKETGCEYGPGGLARSRYDAAAMDAVILAPTPPWTSGHAEGAPGGVATNEAPAIDA